ncbi:TRAP transporter small permease [Vandammella animalimorsus]|uniref:TRAP transporter small permease protein n=1 Tax=Vandammella animalimorsus TaxID=2029117 RepID=A0A3M6R4A6_9BURK|nr:TRAP transporter small permease [Vandammella animalimorsus]RMX10046.1 TRAP transporter small permease [Vandammella animalimorsus]
MKQALDLYCRLLEALCALLMLGMVLLVFGNVVLRYFFQTGWLISEELSRWMFVWMVFLGAVVALREDRHLGTHMLVARLPAWGRQICLLIAQVSMLGISWLLLSGSWSQFLVNQGTNAPVSGLPVSYFYLSGVVFAASAMALIGGALLRSSADLLFGKRVVNQH